jgi:hypothetical protein
MGFLYKRQKKKIFAGSLQYLDPSDESMIITHISANNMILELRKDNANHLLCLLVIIRLERYSQKHSF